MEGIIPEAIVQRNGTGLRKAGLDMGKNNMRASKVSDSIMNQEKKITIVIETDGGEASRIEPGMRILGGTVIGIAHYDSIAKIHTAEQAIKQIIQRVERLYNLL